MKESVTRERAGDVELAVRRAGAGRPLVWGHGLMGSMWVEDQAGIVDWQQVARHADVVRYDARGHGDSAGGYRERDYRWQQLAEDMLALAGSVSRPREKVVIGGLSMGAATALEAAVRQPGRVAGMILALPPTAWETRPRQAAIYRRMGWFSGVFGAAPYRVLDWLPKPVRDDGLSRLAMATIKGLARSDHRRVRAVLRGAALSDMPGRAALGQVDVPTLILAWEDDAAHPVSTSERLAEVLPDVWRLDIARGHDASRWTGLICEFLDHVTTRGSKRGKPRARRRTAA